MALKKIIDIDETFPVLKRARLGAAPPAHDVLDNVGAPELPVKQTPPIQPASTAADKVGEQTSEPTGDDASTANSAKKRERPAKRAGRGIHKSAGTDARRYRTTGRTYQFGARTSADFAEGVKVLALARKKNMTIGELLEDMWKTYNGASKTQLIR